MKVSADEVRAATRKAASVITAETLPPLRLPALPARRGLADRARLAWFAPLAAAAAVIVLVVSSVTAGSRLGGAGTSQPGIAGVAKSAGPADAFSGVPAYYVAMGNPSLAVVRATATGATLVRITSHTPFVGVAGAADDRTFVLDAQNQVNGPRVTWPGQPQFTLLQLTASGTEQSYTRLALAPLPAGAAVSGLALTSDGSKLAVAFDENAQGWPKPQTVLEIRVYTLATGAYRSWSTRGSDDAEAPNGFTGSSTDGSESISWGADSQTLAIDWTNASVIGVRLLDTAASGDNLIADSRLAVTEMTFSGHSGPPTFPFPKKDEVSQCVTDSIMSADGSSVVCGYATNLGGKQTTTGFIRYSTSTGQPVALVGVYQLPGQIGGDINLFWSNATGSVLIGSVGMSSGIRTCVIEGQNFIPLPGIQGLNTAAW
jgi:hypothetical protein